MITLVFDEKNKRPLYEQLYRHIRENIESGTLKPSEKLPSKRKLAAHLQVSQSTVENAYAQLIAEGYIDSVEKKGYYVRKIETITKKLPSHTEIEPKEPVIPENILYDLRTNAVDTENFPFSVWTRLMRECLQNERSTLLHQIHPQGDPRLRQEIVRYLRDFRSMDVSPEQVVLGAGAEYLLGLITELLPGAEYALENPGYQKAGRILDSRRVPKHPILMDQAGMSIEALRNSTANTALVTPSHHFPLGTVMTINRRIQLLRWAYEDENRYLIEDDYDSEYRFALKPIPSLHSLDENDKVIYMNTFARTLAPSLRIGYIVLPRKLLVRYQKTLMFYSCTVSEFEQCTLRDFLSGGYYERHLNRMRTIYRSRRDAFMEGLSPAPSLIHINGQESGLHLLLEVRNGMTEQQLVAAAASMGIKVYPLSEYYFGEKPETSTVVIGYGGFREEALSAAASRLLRAWR